MHSGEALALLMTVRRPPTLRVEAATTGGSNGNTAADAEASGQALQLVDLAKASRLLCRPPCLPPADCDPSDDSPVAAAVSSADLPALPGAFAGSARWPLSVCQQQLGPLMVQQMDCLTQLPLPVWLDAVSGACLRDIRPAHTGVPMRLAEPVASHELQAEVAEDGRGGRGGEAARPGGKRSHRRGVAWLKTVAAPAAALQRLWRECHDVLVQKAVAAASLSGALRSRGVSRERVGGLGTPPGGAAAAKHPQGASGAAAEPASGSGDEGPPVAALRRLHSTLNCGPVAGPVYTGIVSRASPSTIRRHVAASAAAFKKDIASHIAAGARPRPGLLLRDALQGGRGVFPRGCVAAGPCMRSMHGVVCDQAKARERARVNAHSRGARACRISR